MQNYFGTEPELDIARTIRRGLLDAGTDSGAAPAQPQMPQAQMPQAQPSKIDNLLNMAKPMTPKERSIAEHGKGGHIARSIGGFFLGDSDMFTKADYKDQYEADKTRYDAVSAMKENMPAFREYDAQLRDNDPNNDSEALYMMNKMFGADDDLMKQMYGEFGDRGIVDPNATPSKIAQMLREKNISPSDWEDMPAPAKEAFLYNNLDDDYRAAVDATQGLETPEAALARKQAEAEGSGYGQETIRDRQAVTGVRKRIEEMDRSRSAIQEVRDLIATGQADPGKYKQGIRKLFGVETKEDGSMSAAAAQGVIDQLKEVTLGAISKQELEMLYDGLINPSASAESNLGRLDKYLQRMDADREIAINDVKLSWDRLASDEDQADYLEQAESDDWYFNNIGSGSRIESIPAFGGAEEQTFQSYVRERMEALKPFEPKPSRDDLITEFAEERAMAEEAYEIMIREEEEKREAAKLARERLSKPFGTKK